MHKSTKQFPVFGVALALGFLLVGVAGSGATGDPRGTGPAQPWRERYFAGEPLRFGNRVQLLMDDYAVEDTFALKRVIGPMEKYHANPLRIGPEMAWEKAGPSGAYGFQAVVFDPAEKLYKAWSLFLIGPRIPSPSDRVPRYRSTAYVESRDGITWTKPELDLFVVDGRKTNLVIHQPPKYAEVRNITFDLKAPEPARRYHAIVRGVPPDGKGQAILRMYSADGKKWEFAPDPVLLPDPDDGSYSLVQDPERSGWLLYRRPPVSALARMTASDSGFHGYPGVSAKRKVAVSMSRDLRNWTDPRTITIVDERDHAKVNMAGNPLDIDGIKVVRYGDVYLGFIALMDNLKQEIPQHTELMWSRDGLAWERIGSRMPLIPNGTSGDWDGGSVAGVTLVPDGDRIRLYYVGLGVPQSETRLPVKGRMGLALIGRDRFVGWQAGPESGRLLTRQFVVEGDRLEINGWSQVKSPAGPEWSGLIKAELLQPPVENRNAKPYPGFALEDCDPIPVTDNLRQVITWKGSADLSSLKGKTAYVRFFIRSATLFSFRIAESNVVTRD